MRRYFSFPMTIVTAQQFSPLLLMAECSSRSWPPALLPPGVILSRQQEVLYPLPLASPAPRAPASAGPSRRLPGPGVLGTPPPSLALAPPTPRGVVSVAGLPELLRLSLGPRTPDAPPRAARPLPVPHAGRGTSSEGHCGRT